MTILEEFLLYLKTQVENKSIYVWGAQGQGYPTITEKWIRSKETSDDYANKAIALWKKNCKLGYEEKIKAFDCSGLAMYFLQNEKKIFTSDMTANSLKAQCDPIKKSELLKGDWVFRCYSNGKAYHIGYVVDEDLHVIEAKGRTYGVVNNKINSASATYWNYYGRPKIFKEEIEKQLETDVTLNVKVLSKGSKGGEVKTVQQLLIAGGYDLGTSADDGDFGNKTKSAIEQFQTKNKLTVTGKVDSATWKKLISK